MYRRPGNFTNKTTRMAINKAIITQNSINGYVCRLCRPRVGGFNARTWHGNNKFGLCDCISPHPYVTHCVHTAQCTFYIFIPNFEMCAVHSVHSRTHYTSALINYILLHRKSNPFCCEMHTDSWKIEVKKKRHFH